MVADPVIYWLDRQDYLRNVNDAWNRFARENGAPDLVGENVLGKPIWDFISDVATSALYRQLFHKVRSGKRMCLTMRCDAPHMRRTIALTLRKFQDMLEIRAHTLSESPRVKIEAFFPPGPHTEEAVRMCSWCNQIHLENSVWVEIEDAVRRLASFHLPRLPRTIYAICPVCLDKVERLCNEKGSDPFRQGQHP